MNGRKAHHGGAWKVAYADFTTAMMALLLVLWLTAQDEKSKKPSKELFEIRLLRSPRIDRHYPE